MHTEQTAIENGGERRAPFANKTHKNAQKSNDYCTRKIFVKYFSVNVFANVLHREAAAYR